MEYKQDIRNHSIAVYYKCQFGIWSRIEIISYHHHGSCSAQMQCLQNSRIRRWCFSSSSTNQGQRLLVDKNVQQSTQPGIKEKSRVETFHSFGSLSALSGSSSSLLEQWEAPPVVAITLVACTSGLITVFSGLDWSVGLLRACESGGEWVSVLFVLTNLKYSARLSFFLIGLG